jgi:hypothetical protein
MKRLLMDFLYGRANLRRVRGVRPCGYIGRAAYPWSRAGIRATANGTAAIMIINGGKNLRALAAAQARRARSVVLWRRP